MSASPSAGFVAVAPSAAPVAGTFTYAVPEELRGRVEPGMRVLVPFGRRPMTGFVVELQDAAPSDYTGQIKPLRDVLDERPLVVPAVMALARWAANYYMAPLGELIRAALPAGIHSSSARVAFRSPAGDRALATQEPSGIRRLLLELLPSEAPGVECSKLLKAAGKEARMRHLVELARREQISLGYRLKRPAIGVRTRRVYRLAPGGPSEAGRLTAKRSEVLEMLRSAAPGARHLSEIRCQVSSPQSQLRWLVEKGYALQEEEEVQRDPFADDEVARDEAPPWNDEQRFALDRFQALLDPGGYGAMLLHGVTGSGKTEVYLEAIRRVTEQGGQALVLVPEIALTPQLSRRFRARFGDQVAVLHSGLSDGERYDQWRRIRSAAVSIAVGARSAIFAPFEKLGVIVVDEEHDPSYKQDEQPRYNARDLALVRAKQAGAIAILGSATPSLESYGNVGEGKLERVRMLSRPTGGVLPRAELVDLRRYKPRDDNPLTPPLQKALQQTLDSGDQAILFLNRRGWSSVVVCSGCGHTFRCQHCSVGLTHHRGTARLRCHYCDYMEGVPSTCPECGAPDVGLFGVGTEQLEAAVRALLPTARVARLDRDTATRRGVGALVSAMTRGDVDVLVGTQMVTKGHDFPGVTLVGVIAADLGLGLPDFRAAERTFQLLTQVSGRAGRGDREGRVLIQTFNPNHYALLSAVEHDYEAFVSQELVLRRALGYPPFGRLVALKLDAADPERVQQVAQALARRIAARLSRPGALPVVVLGPAPAPLSLLRGRHRWQILLKGSGRDAVRSLAEDAQAAFLQRRPRGVRLALDVDPIHIL